MLDPAVLVLRLDAHAAIGRRPLVLELHFAHATALDDLGATARGVTQQDLVELRAAHLVGVRHRFIPCLGKAKVLPAPIQVNEFRAALEHADGAHLSGDAQALEQRQVSRQQ